MCRSTVGSASNPSNTGSVEVGKPSWRILWYVTYVVVRVLRQHGDPQKVALVDGGSPIGRCQGGPDVNEELEQPLGSQLLEADQ